MTTRPFFVAAAAVLLLMVGACGKKAGRASKTSATLDSASASLGARSDSAAGSVAGTPTASAGAVSVARIALGKRVGLNKHITDTTNHFSPRDVIYASVITNGASPSSKVTARWTYGDGQLVKETTQTLKTSGGPADTEFHIAKPSGWAQGQYQVEILVDGKSLGMKGFQIVR